MDFGLLVVLIGTVAAHFGGFGGQQMAQPFGGQQMAQPFGGQQMAQPFGGQSVGQPQMGYFAQGPPPTNYGPLAPAQQLGVTGRMQPIYNGQQAPAPIYQMVPAPAPSTGYLIQPMGQVPPAVPQPPPMAPPPQPMAPPPPSASYSQGPYPPAAQPPMQSPQQVFRPAIPQQASFVQDNSVLGHPDGHYIPARRVRLIPSPNF